MDKSEQLEVSQADRDAAAWALDRAPNSQTWETLTAAHRTPDQIWQANRVAQAFARHRLATEARMSAAVEADVEKVARIIDPSSWAVMDGYLSDMLRKYKGQKIGYDPDAFKHKPSMKIAEKVIAAIRSQSNG